MFFLAALASETQTVIDKAFFFFKALKSLCKIFGIRNHDNIVMLS